MTELSTTADTETPEQAGKRIANEFLDAGSVDTKLVSDLAVSITTAITNAVAAQKEADAKIAEDDALLCETNSTRYSAKGTANRIAAAIRQGEPS